MSALLSETSRRSSWETESRTHTGCVLREVPADSWSVGAASDLATHRLSTRAGTRGMRCAARTRPQSGGSVWSWVRNEPNRNTATRLQRSGGTRHASSPARVADSSQW